MLWTDCIWLLAAHVCLAGANIGILMEKGVREWDYLNFASAVLNVTDRSMISWNRDSRVDVDESNAQDKTCKIMEREIVALITPHDPLFTSQITSFAQNYNLPLVSFNNVDESTDYRHMGDGAFILRLQPDRRLVAKATTSIIRHFGWRSFTLVYEHRADLLDLADLIGLSSLPYGTTPKLTLAQLPADDRFPLFLKQLQRDNIDARLVVHARLARIPVLLRAAADLQMTGSRFSYIFTHLDLHTLELPRLFRVPGTVDESDLKCNITGFQLTQPTSPRYYPYEQTWRSLAHRNNYELHNEHLPTAAAVVVDTMSLLKRATDQASDCRVGASSCWFRNNYKPEVIYCNQNRSWANGKAWMQLISRTRLEGVTGDVQLSENGQRQNITLSVVHYTQGEQQKLGTWSVEKGFEGGVRYLQNTSEMTDKRLRVVVYLEEPFVMYKKDLTGLTGNEVYEGFAIDLLNHVAKLAKFNFTIHEVNDKNYGTYDEETNDWNGMVGELIRNDADLAVASLTISSGRSGVIDFTVPFMHLGISILFKKPPNEESKLFAFLQPLSLGVWIYLLMSYLTVSLTMWLLARFTPYEWYNPHPHTKFDTADSQFTLLNSLWFTVGSLMQQGSDVAPRAFSTRLVAAVWWFFTVVLISSYTAKLAAFLTVARMSTDIESAEDLAKQEKVKYGTLESGSTMLFFQESKIPAYERMWQFMEASGGSVFVNNSKEGIARVKAGGYAYLMESTMLEYYAERDCELMQIGGLIDSKGYGIGLRKGSPYIDRISQAILKLQELTTIEVLKDKWWSRERGGGKCKVYKVLSSQPSARKLKNIGGIFFILFGGLSLAFCVSLCEFLYKLRNDPALAKLSLCAAIFREMNCGLSCVERAPDTPRRRIRRVSTLMALPLYPQRAGYPQVKRPLLTGAAADGCGCGTLSAKQSINNNNNVEMVTRNAAEADPSPCKTTTGHHPSNVDIPQFGAAAAIGRGGGGGGYSDEDEPVERRTRVYSSEASSHVSPEEIWINRNSL